MNYAWIRSLSNKQGAFYKYTLKKILFIIIGLAQYKDADQKRLWGLQPNYIVRAIFIYIL